MPVVSTQFLPSTTHPLPERESPQLPEPNQFKDTSAPSDERLASARERGEKIDWRITQEPPQNIENRHASLPDLWNQTNPALRDNVFPNAPPILAQSPTTLGSLCRDSSKLSSPLTVEQEDSLLDGLDESDLPWDNIVTPNYLNTALSNDTIRDSPSLGVPHLLDTVWFGIQLHQEYLFTSFYCLRCKEHRLSWNKKFLLYKCHTMNGRYCIILVPCYHMQYVFLIIPSFATPSIHPLALKNFLDDLTTTASTWFDPSIVRTFFSRIDIATDIQTDYEVSYSRDDYLTHLKTREDPYFGYFVVGARSLLIRIYSRFFQSMWSAMPGYRPNSPVVRVEPQFRRPELRKNGIDNIRDLQELSTFLERLWQKAMRSLRNITPKKGKNKSRGASLTPFWLAITGVTTDPNVRLFDYENSVVGPLSATMLRNAHILRKQCDLRKNLARSGMFEKPLPTQPVVAEKEPVIQPVQKMGNANLLDERCDAQASLPSQAVHKMKFKRVDTWMNIPKRSWTNHLPLATEGVPHRKPNRRVKQPSAKPLPEASAQALVASLVHQALECSRMESCLGEARSALQSPQNILIAAPEIPKVSTQVNERVLRTKVHRIHPGEFPSSALYENKLLNFRFIVPASSVPP